MYHRVSCVTLLQPYPDMNKHVLITAGGSGSRIVSAVPKQFLPLGNRPVLMHVFDAFMRFSPDLHFVLVLQEPFHSEWKALCRKHQFRLQHTLVSAGPTRFHSVKNGLNHIPDKALVAVHDGVRPLLSPALIARVFYFAEKFGSAIPVVHADESVRLTDKALNTSLPRDRIRLVQTPQCFQSTAIRKAYNKNYHESFTDEATVFEAEGHRLFLVDGEKTNIKITTGSDLVVAEALLTRREY